jgi:hypothetical protein
VGPLHLNGSNGAIWDVSQWNDAEWSSTVFEESLSTFPTARPRGRAIDLLLVEESRLRVDLRDFELVYLPVDRPIGPATVTTEY